VSKAIVKKPDPLDPRITRGFLEYAQARHFHIDPARVRHARDQYFTDIRGITLCAL
jgi:hypothetical protein